MVRRKTGVGPDTREKKRPRTRGQSNVRASGDGGPIQRLIASIKNTESSLARQRTPRAARVRAILAEFRGRLGEAIDEQSTPIPNTADSNRTAKQRRNDTKPVPTNTMVERFVTPGPGADIERLRVYSLHRVSGTVAKQIVVCEPIDESVDPEDIAFRVGCLELADDEPWTWVDGSVEGDAIRIYFPDDLYYGFPPFLDLERPRRPQIGQTWRLLRNDGATAATYVLRSVDLTERPRSK